MTRLEIDGEALLKLVGVVVTFIWMVSAVVHVNDPSGVVYALLTVANEIGRSRSED